MTDSQQSLGDAPTMSGALVPTRLADLEAVIERGLETFVEVGTALAEIRAGRLYRETHGTFEAYCRERWGWSARHANRQIAAAEVVATLGPMGPIPANERQARAMLATSHGQASGVIAPDPGSASKYAVYPDLDPATESALSASIDRFGVLVPVVKDQHGNILDGHQRARIADSLGIKYPVNIVDVADEDEAREIVRTMNEDRCQPTEYERLNREMREAQAGMERMVDYLACTEWACVVDWYKQTDASTLADFHQTLDLVADIGSEASRAKARKLKRELLAVAP